MTFGPTYAGACFPVHLQVGHATVSAVNAVQPALLMPVAAEVAVPSQAFIAHPFMLYPNLPSPLLRPLTMHLIKGLYALPGLSLKNRTGLCGHVLYYALVGLSKDKQGQHNWLPYAAKGLLLAVHSPHSWTGNDN